MGQAKQGQAEISKIKVESSTVNAVALGLIVKRHLVEQVKSEFVVAEEPSLPTKQKK